MHHPTWPLTRRLVVINAGDSVLPRCPRAAAAARLRGRRIGLRVPVGGRPAVVVAGQRELALGVVDLQLRRAAEAGPCGARARRAVVGERGGVGLKQAGRVWFGMRAPGGAGGSRVWYEGAGRGDGFEKAQPTLRCAWRGTPC